MCLSSGAVAARIGFQRDFYRLQLDARRRRQTQREWLKDWMHGGAFVRRARWWISVSQASSSRYLPTDAHVVGTATAGWRCCCWCRHTNWFWSQLTWHAGGLEGMIWETCLICTKTDVHVVFHPRWQFSIAVNGLSVPRCAEVRPKWTVSRVGLKPAREPGAVASPNRSQLVPTSLTRLVSP